MCFVYRWVRMVEVLLLSILALWSVPTYQKQRWNVSVQANTITRSTSKVPLHCHKGVVHLTLTFDIVIKRLSFMYNTPEVQINCYVLYFTLPRLHSITWIKSNMPHS